MFFTIAVVAFLLTLVSVINKGYRLNGITYVVAALLAIIPFVNAVVAILASAMLVKEAYKTGRF